MLEHKHAGKRTTWQSHNTHIGGMFNLNAFKSFILQENPDHHPTACVYILKSTTLDMRFVRSTFSITARNQTLIWGVNTYRHIKMWAIINTAYLTETE